ncbi:MAG: hypothetical protein KGI41_00150 [Patescibacteria group bacterium]|nr:hypothetical protein [Patescibacteria group bacterium]MDE1965643.1 hypothetical protein [Patescibacteria group bacterium]
MAAALTPATFLANVEGAIVNPLITLIALAAFVLFLWGGVEFIMNAGDESKREEGKKKLIWGLVGLVVIFGAKAILSIALATFGITPPA